MPAEGIGIPSGNPRQKNTQSYLLALVCFQVSGSYGFIPIFGDFFYPLLTLLLHLFHLIDALAPLGKEGRDKYRWMCLYTKCVPAVMENPLQ